MATTTISELATAQRCRDTPTLSVFDNRGLQVRTVRYNRSAVDEAPDELITRQTWSPRGDPASTIDARLFDEQRQNPAILPNLRYTSSLSGRPLAILSQDAGERLSLCDAEGGLVLQRDGRGQQLSRIYDTLHRLVAVTEQAEDGAVRVSERLVYGDAAPPDGANLCGRLRQHYTAAGLNVIPAYSLAGQPLSNQQQFLRDDRLDSDWAGDDPAAWGRDLLPDTYTSRWAYDAYGREIERTDARGNLQRLHYNIAGQLAASDLRLDGRTNWQPLLRAITYSAAGQVQHEEAGNGVVTDYTYEPQTQRLAELRTTRAAQTGRSPVVQALAYQYDPVGNLLAIDDAAQATRHTRNQRVAPASGYTYDALYQLTRATGRENANAGRQSQALPPAIVPLFQETDALTNYTRTYRYDRGTNLIEIHHQGTTPYTQQMVVARTSNRAVPQTDGLTPGDVNSYFDACGNLRELGPGQPLTWDSRNQLQRTAQIVRRGADDDYERYWYDGAGQRATKLNSARTSGTTRIERVRYLPGLELRQTEQARDGEESATPLEILQVLTLGAAGRQSVRVLHWERGRPETIENDQLRYSLGDQVGSSMIELDAQADLLTREEYYPYGGTAVWSARSDIEAKYKYVRYSDQERDATGLYYYGFRYYAPWLARWINPDPVGPIDGLNLFCMVGNNPVTRKDVGGLAREEEQPLLQLPTQNAGRSLSNLASGAQSGIRRTGRQIRAQFIPSERSEPYVVFENGVYGSTTEQVEVRHSGISRLAGALRTRVTSALTSLIPRPRERAPETIPLLDIAPETSRGSIYTALRPAESERAVRPRSSGYRRLSEPPSSRLAEEAARLLNPQSASPGGQGAEIELNTLSRENAGWEEAISRAHQILGQAPATLNPNEFELVHPADINEINMMLGEMEVLNIAEALYQITSEGPTSLLESALEATPLLGEERARGRMDPWSFVSFTWWASPFLSSAFAFSFFGFSWAINARRSGL
ncbi:RHS repeat-associated core domain-containing protein [Burkholderia pseudomallei]|uniref:RHS repeat-associated core domain-containing protein n=1 Tax=Burkholderia pseudomallei TaxID=28450 RepID=UPI00040411B2|nr:RHS repeat-associated core domain-containing protein [Burkholderia pseudomallei]AIP56048.1 RHS repeat-associated core domain protein [Burkholderia pseudomallei HBPUB10303a]AYX04211.1 RHS repeat protein [Burkholderia pseudomallei]MBF3493161.1 RHS repeat protein [Burkholderia pseudomallei]MBF4052243.1 RHS repeat protein [Burkholderia pseudomallei]MBO2970131.1 RHS repeat protein [Burkholderia pseudomallei]